jgi:hypothetical protein
MVVHAQHRVGHDWVASAFGSKYRERRCGWCSPPSAAARFEDNSLVEFSLSRRGRVTRVCPLAPSACPARWAHQREATARSADLLVNSRPGSRRARRRQPEKPYERGPDPTHVSVAASCACLVGSCSCPATTARGRRRPTLGGPNHSVTQTRHAIHTDGSSITVAEAGVPPACDRSR